MKSFDKNLAKICDVEISTLLGSYKYEIFGGHTCVLEGHKGLLSFSSETISFKVQKGTFEVTGKNLTICTLDRQFAVVRGDIFRCGVEAK